MSPPHHHHRDLNGKPSSSSSRPNTASSRPKSKHRRPQNINTAIAAASASTASSSAARNTTGSSRDVDPNFEYQSPPTSAFSIPDIPRYAGQTKRFQQQLQEFPQSQQQHQQPKPLQYHYDNDFENQLEHERRQRQHQHQHQHQRQHQFEHQIQNDSSQQRSRTYSGDSSHLYDPKNHQDDDSERYPYPPNASFLENASPIDVDMADKQPPSASIRDSHDLSYSSRDVTRDSLFTNMLLSLDQFSSANGPGVMGGAAINTNPTTYDDSPQLFESSRSWTSPVTAPRHKPSYSSDLEAQDDTSRISSQTSRGRRSNSSSNFHNTYTRLNSVRELGHPSQPSTPRGARHSRGAGKESKSSSLTSVDAAYAQLHQQQRGGRGPPPMARSASFDHSNAQYSSQLDNVPVSPFKIEFSETYLNHDDAVEYDEAAPNPTIPNGPRRTPSQAAMLPPPPPEPKHVTNQHVSRRGSLSRSIKSSSGKKGPSTRDTAEIPAAPAPMSPELDSAPAPHVGYGKTKEAQRKASQGSAAPAAPKEKQGFFRRVFGGGSAKAAPSPAPERQLAGAVASPSETSETAGTSGSHGAAPGPPSRDASSTHSSRAPPLQKKPSSFFRRRKKSVADQAPPPLPADAPPVPPVAPLNLHTHKDRHIERPKSSSVSSLREVMTPYLDKEPAREDMPLSDITNTPDRYEDSRERGGYQRGFSPDYEPSPTAKIRQVHTVESDYEQPSRHGTPSRPPPSRPGEPERRNNSFLNLDGGSDDNDDSKSALDEQRGYMTSRKDDTIRAKKHAVSPGTYQTDSADTSRSKLALPIEGVRAVSPASAVSRTESRSGTSAAPSVYVEAPTEPMPHVPSPKVLGTLEGMKAKPLDEPDFVIGEPTEDDRKKAKQIYDGLEDFIPREKAAAWMGEEGPVRQRTLQAYMELYDFKSQSIVAALRQVCERLIFKAETQQVDRILVAFSKQWCESNPNHGFKATDVIHMICYSIMLLNTDLHVADIESKMTRSQFVKNTMTTISHAVKELAPESFKRLTILPDKPGRPSTEPAPESESRSFRHSFRPPPRLDTQNLGDYANDCGPLVRAPFEGTFRAWEEQVETVLKNTYASIREQRLPLYGAEPDAALMQVPQSGLSVKGMLKRSPSVLSKAPSESAMSMRGRVPESMRGPSSARWNSKSRSRVNMSRTGPSSSRTSFDEASSMWSPALSSATWSKYSLGRTQTSVSQDSFAISMGRGGDYQQSIGFANALSQAIIRNDDATEGAPSIMSEELPDQLLEDESLELAGPPWVKEGRLFHKHHLDGVDKKAKERNWSEVFAVIQKGQMSLFSFAANKSQRQKSRSRPKLNVPVGGGNWQDNATNMGTFNLRQTLASALPSPGYSRSRPHVWALSLPTGAVHLFQVGTPEIIKEFVSTANYWSARLSTHPLVGGISNIEYGWGDEIVNNSLVMAINDTTGPKEGRSGTGLGRRSNSISGRSIRSVSIDLGSRAFAGDGGRGKLPGDRIHIAAWAPPTQSMRPSTLREEAQLSVLNSYVKTIEDDLQTHNQLRSPMLLAFAPRGSNAQRAMANWERKSSYLLREIVKYRTYVDTLTAATQRRLEVYGERDLARRAARGELSDGDFDSQDDGDNFEEDEDEMLGVEGRGGTLRARS